MYNHSISTHPLDVTADEWDKYIRFWNDPRNIARAAQNRQNRVKSTVISRQGSRLLARLRDEMKGRAQPLRSTRRSLTPSSWHTLLTGNSFGMRTDEEMRRLEATGTYTDDEINRLARGAKHFHKMVDFMMSLFKSDSKYSDMFSQFESGGASRSGGCGDDEEGADDQDDEDEDGDGDT
nr:hypothetical protein [Tanacetum cinerariifolium]